MDSSLDSGGASGAPGTVRDLEQRLARALEVLGELTASGRLPEELEPLRQLAPQPGCSANVALHYAAEGPDPNQLGRDMSDDAGVHEWQPRPGHAARVWYGVRAESRDPVDAGSLRETPLAAPAPSRPPIPQELRDLVRELDRAERGGMPYVVLKWFRDTCLPSSRLPWTLDLHARQRVLSDAIDLGLVTTAKVTNPRNPAQPSTTVRLVRSHPDVAAVLTRPEALPEFRPVPIRGEPLSETIIRERR